MQHKTLDRIGMFSSAACAVHCAILPIVVSILPLVGLGFLADERVEFAFLTTSGMLGLASLCWGFKKHGKMHALGILAGGIGLMAVGHMAEESSYGVLLAVLGGLSIAGSHILNHYLCNTCRDCKE